MKTPRPGLTCGGSPIPVNRNGAAPGRTQVRLSSVPEPDPADPGVAETNTRPSLQRAQVRLTGRVRRADCL